MTYDEEECLRVDPFEGDFGDPSDKILKDKIVTARKARSCYFCEEDVVPGTRIRTRTMLLAGQLHCYSWCEKCCAAMAKSWDDDGFALYQRAWGQ